LGNLRRGTATAKLNRKDHWLNWNQVLETGGIVVGDEVKATIDVELVKSE
jgi:polyisoprenoid-binding protein YceI